MQIVLIQFWIILPRLPLKHRIPVIGRLTLSVDNFAFSPEVPVVVWVVVSLFTFLEPLAFVRSMVDDEIHDNFDAFFMAGIQQSVEVFHGSVFRINSVIIRDIIAIVRLRGGINGRKPDTVNSEALQIVELLIYSVQVTDAVSI